MRLKSIYISTRESATMTAENIHADKKVTRQRQNIDFF